MSALQGPAATRRTVSLQDIGVPLGVSYALLFVTGVAIGGSWQGAPIVSIMLFFSYAGPFLALGVLVNNAVSAHPVTTLGSLWHVVPAIVAGGGLAYLSWRMDRRWLRLVSLSATATLWAMYGFYCLGLIGALDA